MRNFPSSTRQGGTLALATALLIGLLAPRLAEAGQFYVSGDLAVAGTMGETSGTVAVGGSGSAISPLSTDEGDSSPVFGAALGFAFPLQHVMSWESPKMPRWLPLDLSTPRWTIRTEFEWIGITDWEIRTNTPMVANADFVTDVKTWGAFANLWIDMPLQGPVEAAFGRSPWIRPFSFYGGGGLGLGFADTDASNNIDRGSKETYGFAFQAGAGFGYQVTPNVSLSLGYRYVDQGTTSVNLSGGGELDIDLDSHAFTTQLTWDFYWLPFPNRRTSKTFFD